MSRSSSTMTRAQETAAPASPVAMGRVTKPHGLGGACRVRPYGAEETYLLEAPRVWARTEAEDGSERWRVLTVKRAGQHKTVVLLQFAEVATVGEAERLRGAELYVPRAALPEPAEGEYYWHDLIGLRVLEDATGRDLGEVASLVPMAGADNLVIREPGGREWMLPFEPRSILEVDLEAGRIRVDVPEGLHD